LKCWNDEKGDHDNESLKSRNKSIAFTPETLDVVDEAEAAEIIAAKDEVKVKAEMNAIQRERNVGIAEDHFHTQKHHRSCIGVLRPFGLSAIDEPRRHPSTNRGSASVALR